MKLPGKFSPLLVYFALFFLLFPHEGNAQKPVRSRAEKIENGQFLFHARSCSSCHMVLGKGGEVGPYLTRAISWASPLLGAAVMWNHVPIMEKTIRKKGYSWPQFKDDDIEDIFIYLHSLRQQSGGDVPFRGETVTGKSLFVGSRCIICHGEPFKGGLIGPDLGLKAKNFKSESVFATRMLLHAPHMLTQAKRFNIFWPQLTGLEMAHFFAYLNGLEKSISDGKNAP